MDNQKEITAQKIIRLRKEKGWSQMQVARKLVIPRGRYAAYEERRALVPHEIIRRICAAYRITLDEFDGIKIPANHVSII